MPKSQKNVTTYSYDQGYDHVYTHDYITTEYKYKKVSDAPRSYLSIDNHKLSEKLTLGYLIKKLKEARENGENICLYVDKTLDLGLSQFESEFKRKEDTVLYSLNQNEDYWYMALTGKSKEGFYAYIKEHENTYKSQKISNLLQSMSDETIVVAFEEIESVSDFYRMFDMLKTARQENKNVTVKFVSKDHNHTRFSINSLTYTEAHIDVIMQGIEKEFFRLFKPKSYNDIKGYKDDAKPLIWPGLEDLWDEFLRENCKFDQEGFLTEVPETVTKLLDCLKMVENGTDIEQIKSAIGKDESLLALILQFSKKGPSFARAYRGENITSEDEKHIKEIEERNTKYIETMVESNPLRKKLIKKIKSANDGFSKNLS